MEYCWNHTTCAEIDNTLTYLQTAFRGANFADGARFAGEASVAY